MKWIIVLMCNILLITPSAFTQKYSVQSLNHKNTKVSRIDDKLQLTPTQNQKVKLIREEAKQRIEIIKKDRALDPTVKEVKVRQVVKDAQLKKMEVLTPNQQKIFSEELKQRE